jgi:RNA polymerase sigma factor (sigma-70 family)
VQPDSEFDRQIHERLLSRHVTAPAEFAEAYLPIIVLHLKKKFPKVSDRAFLEESAAEAILGFSKSPHTYDPTKLSLSSFLKMAAERDLFNLLRRERPHIEKEILSDDVEQTVQARNTQYDGSLRYTIEEQLVGDIDRDSARRTLEAHFRNPRDRKLLELMRSGERSTTAFAEVLGISALTNKEQKIVVKQHKDRITKEIERLGAKSRVH